ncbi:MAG: cytochrome c biogenesis CcdA family protein [Candidatus Hodarchaeales archaeon]
MVDFPFFGIIISEQIGLLPFFILAGLATGLSPCLFPILPLTLLSVFRAETNRVKAILLVMMVISGMMTSFTIFTLLVSYISLFLIKNYIILNQIFGFLIIIFGIILIIPRLQDIFVRLTSRFSTDQPTESLSYLTLYFLGMTYTFIAIPCSGPIFLSVTAILITIAEPILTMFGLIIFGLGIFIPYAILAVASAEARMKIANKLVSKQYLLERIVGIFLVLYGALIILSTIIVF